MSTAISRNELVSALEEMAVEQVVAGELRALEKPPGRRPLEPLVRRSEWYRGLDDQSRLMVGEIMESAAYGALHRVMVILDRGAFIDEPPHPGSLRLWWVDSALSIDLTEPGDGPELHDLLAAARSQRR